MTIRAADGSFHILMPPELRLRALETAKKMHLRPNAFFILAINEKINRVDEEERQKKQKTVADRMDGRGLDRGMTGISRTMPETDTKPLSSSLADKYADLDRRQPRSKADELLYTELARHILGAGDDPVEIKRRAMKAVDSVRKARPLTCPPEGVILEALEEHLAKLRLNEDANAAAPDSAYDKLVGKVLDVKKIKSLGDVPTDE